MTLSRFFFNDTATTEIYTLSLHDALLISGAATQNLEQAQGSRLCFQFCRIIGDLCEEFLLRRLVLSFLTWRTATATAAAAALVALRLVTVSLALCFLWRFGHGPTHVAERDNRFETTALRVPLQSPRKLGKTAAQVQVHTTGECG